MPCGGGWLRILHRQDGEVHCLTLAALRTLTLDFLMVLLAVLNCAFLQAGAGEREDSYSFKEFEVGAKNVPERLGSLNLSYRA